MRHKQNYTATVFCISLILACGFKATSYASTKMHEWRETTLTKELNELFGELKPTKTRKPNEPVEWSTLSREELEQLTYSAMKQAATCRDATELAVNHLKTGVTGSCASALDILEYDGFRLKKH